MAKTVFVLGAGASKQAGAPLMIEFLDVARDLWQGSVAKNPDAFKTVFEGISALQQVHSKSRLDIHNVETVFAAFEMAKTFGRFAAYSVDEIEALITAMREVIVRTLDATIAMKVRDGRPVAPEPYGNFVNLISDLRGKARPKRDVAVLTFNYDVCADFAFHQAGTEVDYRLDTASHAGALSLLKLHGSLNWGWCAKCNATCPWHLDDYFSKYSWRFISEMETVSMSIGDHVRSYEHCGTQVERAPVIVPPTWNKTEHQRSIGRVWSAAAEELSTAEDLFVIGYSLPESDAFFRYLYALGTVGESALRRVWVFNPDTSGAVEGRFRALLGPGAEERFRYVPETFENAIGTIRNEFNRTFER